MLNLGPFELRLGKKFVFTALEEAVRSMRVGEVAVFSLPEPVRRYLDGVFSPIYLWIYTHLSSSLYQAFANSRACLSVRPFVFLHLFCAFFQLIYAFHNFFLS